MQTIQSTKSLARLFRQMVYIPSPHNRWLTKTVKTTIDTSDYTGGAGSSWGDLPDY